MGWMVGHRPKWQSPKEYLLKNGLFTFSSLPECERPQVVDHAQVGRVHYFAVRVPAEYLARHGASKSYLPDADGSVTGAVIVLTESFIQDYSNFGYKDIDECSGSYEAKCPERILRKLSTLIDPAGYAAQWREACRANRARKQKALRLVDGLAVELPVAVRFGDGVMRQKFHAVKRLRKRGFLLRCDVTGALCKLDGAMREALRLQSVPKPIPVTVNAVQLQMAL